MSVLKSVLIQIKPSRKEEESMKRSSDRILKIAEYLGEKYSFKPMFCGSLAKKTILSDKNEFDLFLLFKTKVPRKDLEKIGLKVAKNIIRELRGKYEIAYAEHPYLRGFVRKYQIDIVPCYAVKSAKKIKSAVDRTPFHVKYVRKYLKKPDEVLLLKKFCEANECYGADVKTQGFSGYLCELLIIKFKTFSNLVKKASRWRARTILTKTKLEFKSPLVFIDPVDKNRNVAAAVSAESFYRFVKACNDFKKKPNKRFFFKEKIKPYSIMEISKEIKKRGTRWYLIKFKRPKIVDDTLYPQMRRCLNSLEKILNKNGFRVLEKTFWCDKYCVIILEMEIWQVPRLSKNIGPDVHSRHAEDFLKHYKNYRVFIENGKWIVEKDRDFIAVLHLLKNLRKKSNQDLLGMGIPNKISPQLKKANIDAGGESLKAISKLPKEFRTFLRKWFERDLNMI